VADLLKKNSRKMADSDAHTNDASSAASSGHQELGDAAAKAFDFAQDVTKQVLTLSTGIIALTITFFKDFANHAPHVAEILMGWSWIAYLASVVLGLWTLMALTGTLQPLHPGNVRPSIERANVRLPALLQLVCFLIALILSVWSGIRTL
jgi:hypothetical protein